MQLAEILGTGLDRTARLVQDLRDFATPKHVPRSAYMFSALINDAIHLISSTIREKGISIRCEVDSNEPQLIGDSQAMEQVILNILKNAVDALDGRTQGEIEISVRTDQAANSLVVEFKDNGPGVSAEIIQRLFEPFFSTKPPGKGTGLGLALCNRVIQDHHGEILVSSESGRGATVKIRLPVDRAYNS